MLEAEGIALVIDDFMRLDPTGEPRFRDRGRNPDTRARLLASPARSRIMNPSRSRQAPLKQATSPLAIKPPEVDDDVETYRTPNSR